MPTTAWSRIKEIASPNGKDSSKARVSFRVAEVTPEMAEEWLRSNLRNRRLIRSRVLHYAREMRNGRWRFNGESVKFDWNGNLIDGQHRLAAIIEAGVTVSLAVTSGLDPEAFLSFDLGKPRSIAHSLDILGENPTDANILSTALAHLRRYERGDLWSTSAEDKFVSPEEAAEVLDRYPAIRGSLAYAKAQTLLPKSMVCFCHFVFAQKDADLAGWFWEAFGSGVGLNSTDAVWHLRERLINDRASHARVDWRHKLALTVKAWGKHRAGEACRQLKWMPDRESYPEVV